VGGACGSCGRRGARNGVFVFRCSIRMTRLLVTRLLRERAAEGGRAGGLLVTRLLPRHSDFTRDLLRPTDTAVS
jgi:hypothetical protein